MIKITVLAKKWFCGVYHFEETDYDCSDELAHYAVREGIARGRKARAARPPCLAWRVPLDGAQPDVTKTGGSHDTMGGTMSKRELVDLPCILKHQTQNAYLFDMGLDEDVWIPKSQAEYHKEGRNEIVTVPEWLAKDKGLI